MKQLLSYLAGLSLLMACGPAPSGDTSEAASQPPMFPAKDLDSLFHDVQMAAIFEDSKTFVDCRPTTSAAEIVAGYQRLKRQPDFDLEQFVKMNFKPPRVFSTDFQADPARDLSEHIQALWPVLTREPDDDIQGSLIELPHPYVVPGGRFREIYYWDSYFTMLGLAVSDSVRQALIGHMLQNFAYEIDTLGFIPNGNRTYFLSRSQPPFFSLMVKLWDDLEGNQLDRYLPHLEAEYAFWMDGADSLSEGVPAYRRVVRLPDGTILNRYWDDDPSPRPESYREDVLLAQSAPPEKGQLFRNLRAACESGWDFSSRWLRDPQDLATIRTTELLPIDLNCLLYHLELTLAEAYAQRANPEKQDYYQRRAKDRADAINRFFWDGTQYSDFDWVKQIPTALPTAAMMYPLYFEVAPPARSAATVAAMEAQLLAPGGVLTTPVESGQQWDAPNGWAPLQWMSVEGLRRNGFDSLAQSLSERWMTLNERVYHNTGKMVEKYNVSDLSLKAGGGEYPLQDGFGWSNGVMLRMLWEAKQDRPRIEAN
jgi:alpha,alpha-trehalase